MSSLTVLRGVDAVTAPVPDLDQGLRFYRDQLGHELVWRNDTLGQVGLRLPESQAELVLSTNLEYAVKWLVMSVSEAVETIVEAGGKVILKPTQIPVGRLAVVNDPFGNALVLLDLSAGLYVTCCWRSAAPRISPNRCDSPRDPGVHRLSNPTELLDHRFCKPDQCGQQWYRQSPQASEDVCGVSHRV